jgi:hypothetical protein
MRKGILMLMAVASLSGGCRSGADPVTEAEKVQLTQEVRETLEGLTEAMNAGDPEELFRYYRQDEEFLFLGCTDFLLGWGTFSSRIGPFYSAQPNITFQQEVVRIQVLSRSVAVAALRGGSSETHDLFWTEVLVKEGGRWLIAHEHESWPGCPPPSEPHPFTSGAGMSGAEPRGSGLESVESGEESGESGRESGGLPAEFGGPDS